MNMFHIRFARSKLIFKLKETIFNKSQNSEKFTAARMQLVCFFFLILLRRNIPSSM